MSKKPTVLMILDGYGLRADDKGNAVAEGKTPVMDKLMTECPFVKECKRNGSRTSGRTDGKFRSRTFEYGSWTNCISRLDKNHKVNSGWRFL